MNAEDHSKLLTNLSVCLSVLFLPCGVLFLGEGNRGGGGSSLVILT